MQERLPCSVPCLPPRTANQMPSDDDTLLAAQAQVLVTSLDMDYVGVKFHRAQADSTKVLATADRIAVTPQGCLGLRRAALCASLWSHYCQQLSWQMFS